MTHYCSMYEKTNFSKKILSVLCNLYPAVMVSIIPLLLIITPLCHAGNIKGLDLNFEQTKDGIELVNKNDGAICGTARNCVIVKPKNRNAVLFNGQNSYAYIPYTYALSVFHGKGFKVQVSLKFNKLNVNQAIFFIKNSFLLWVNDKNNLIWTFEDSNAKWNPIYSFPQLKENKWYDISVVFKKGIKDTNYLEVYLGSKLLASRNLKNTPPPVVTALYLGAFVAQRKWFLNGIIKNFKVSSLVAEKANLKDEKSISTNWQDYFDFDFCEQPLFKYALVADTHNTGYDETTCKKNVFASDLKTLGRDRMPGVRNLRTMKVVEQINNIKPDFVVHLGDMVNALPEHKAYESQVKKCLEIFSPLKMPVYYTPGNHETANKKSIITSNFIKNPQYFHVNEKKLAEYEKDFGAQYFSFNHKNCHFIILNSTIFASGLPSEQKQYAWLKQNLEKVAKGKHIIVCLHQPFFWVSPADQGKQNYEICDEPPELLALLSKYGVKTVYAGHTHHPVFNYFNGTSHWTLPSTSFHRNLGFYSDIPGGNLDPAKNGYFVTCVYPRKIIEHFICTREKVLEYPGIQSGNNLIKKRLVYRTSRCINKGFTGFSASLPEVLDNRQNSLWSAKKAIDGLIKNKKLGECGWTSIAHAKADSKEWLTVQLPSSTLVSKILLYPRQVCFPESFKIETSSNGKNWDKIVEKRNFSKPEAFQPVAFNVGKNCKFVRFSADKLSHDWSKNVYRASLMEIEILDKNGKNCARNPGTEASASSCASQDPTALVRIRRNDTALMLGSMAGGKYVFLPASAVANGAIRDTCCNSIKSWTAAGMKFILPLASGGKHKVDFNNNSYLNYCRNLTATFGKVVKLWQLDRNILGKNKNQDYFALYKDIQGIVKASGKEGKLIAAGFTFEEIDEIENFLKNNLESDGLAIDCANVKKISLSEYENKLKKLNAVITNKSRVMIFLKDPLACLEYDSSSERNEAVVLAKMLLINRTYGMTTIMPLSGVQGAVLDKLDDPRSTYYPFGAIATVLKHEFHQADIPGKFSLDSKSGSQIKTICFKDENDNYVLALWRTSNTGMGTSKKLILDGFHEKVKAVNPMNLMTQELKISHPGNKTQIENLNIGDYPVILAFSKSVSPEPELQKSVMEANAFPIAATNGAQWHAKWIWGRKNARINESFFFRKDFTLNSNPVSAAIQITADNSYKLFVNGKLIAGDNAWSKAECYDLSNYLRKGDNSIIVEAGNEAGSAGLLAEMNAYLDNGDSFLLTTDRTWKCYSREPKPGDKSSTAIELGSPPTPPWGVLKRIKVDIPGKLKILDTNLPESLRTSEKFDINVSLQVKSKINENNPFYIAITKKGYELERKYYRTVPATSAWCGIVNLKLAMKIPKYIPCEGKFRFILGVDGVGNKVVREVILERSPKDKTEIAKKANCKVARTSAGPVMLINNTRMVPVSCRLKMSKNGMSMAKFATSHGIKQLCSSTYGVPKRAPYWNNPEENNIEEDIDICRILNTDPEAYIIINLLVDPPQFWKKANPDDLLLTEKGFRGKSPGGDVSPSSEKWLTEGGAVTTKRIKHLEKLFGNRIIMYWLRGVHDGGEWFYDSAIRNDVGSLEAVVKGQFQKYMRKQYGKIETLNKKWRTNFQAFAEINAPSVKKQSVTEYGEFRKPETAGMVIDFYKFRQNVMADAINYFAKIIKDICEWKKLVMVSYGYVFEFSWFLAGPQESGHLAIGKILKSPYVDALMPPLSYYHRDWDKPGCSMIPMDSVALAGKLPVIDDDIRTHLSMRGDHNPCDTLEHSIATYQRDFGMSFVRNGGIQYSDWVGTGRLNDVRFWKSFQQLVDLYKRKLNNPISYKPEIAVIVDIESLFYLGLKNKITGPLIANMRSELRKTGAPLGWYLMDDMLENRIPAAKLYIFLNAFALNAGQRIRIKKILDSARATALWFYAPGIINGNTIGAQNISDLVGMPVKQKKGMHSDTIMTKNGPLGANRQLKTLFYIENNKQLKILGKYRQGGHIGAAITKIGSWNSVFVGAISAKATFLREIALKAGVHVYIDSDDVISTDGKYLFVTALSSGRKTVVLPKPAVVKAYPSDTYINSGEKTKEICVNMQKGETGIWIIE